MRIPTIQGVIERRLLVNFRVDPVAIARVLPAPFRPLEVSGFAMAGICLIRLARIRPVGMPSFLGISSENAAHRIAVEWDRDGEPQQGVYIPRRDTDSRMNAFVGGRVFPGVHHFARFEVREDDPAYRVEMQSADSDARVMVEGTRADALPESSIFDSVDAVSAFFEQGSLGYSPRRTDGEFDGLELQSFNWSVEPLDVTAVESSFFDDRSVFPDGTVAFDNALLMRDIDHQWHGRQTLCCP